MPSWFFGVLANGAIPFLAGVCLTLMAFRVVGSKLGANPKQDEWYRRFGGLMKGGGPLLVVFGIFLWVWGFAQHADTRPTTPAVWLRHTTSDGAASAEFPAPPQAANKDVQGFVAHNVTLSQKERDCHYILSWSETGSEPGVSDDELLDRLREVLEAESVRKGIAWNVVSEEKVVEAGCAGRVLKVTIGEKTTQRFKCFIANGRLYRAIATTPRSPQEDADGVRFVSSFRLEQSKK